MIEEHELIRIKKTKFVEMSYNLGDRYLLVAFNNYPKIEGARTMVEIPINKIPQIIRGLFSAYQRFHRLKKK